MCTELSFIHITVFHFLKPLCARRIKNFSSNCWKDNFAGIFVLCVYFHSMIFNTKLAANNSVNCFLGSAKTKFCPAQLACSAHLQGILPTFIAAITFSLSILNNFSVSVRRQVRIFLFCRAYLIFISMADIKVADFVPRSCPPPLPSPQSFLFSVSSLTPTLCQNVFTSECV